MNELLPPEAVVRLDDPQTGLRGFIVLHSTVLGPAAGGCRLWHYADEAAASEDALRLAAGMTMKNALAGLPLGGGKAVLILPRRRSAARSCSRRSVARSQRSTGAM